VVWKRRVVGGGRDKLARAEWKGSGITTFGPGFCVAALVCAAMAVVVWGRGRA